jgi:hypothetical protein
MSLSFPDLQKLSPWVTAEVVCWVLLDHQMDKVELRACFENHGVLFAKLLTINRIMASFSSVSLVCNVRS